MKRLLIILLTVLLLYTSTFTTRIVFAQEEGVNESDSSYVAESVETEEGSSEAFEEESEDLVLIEESQEAAQEVEEPVETQETQDPVEADPHMEEEVFDLNETGDFPPKSFEFGEYDTYFPSVKYNELTKKFGGISYNDETIRATTPDSDFFNWTDVSMKYTFSEMTSTRFTLTFKRSDVLRPEDIDIYVYKSSDGVNAGIADTTVLTYVKKMTLADGISSDEDTTFDFGTDENNIALFAVFDEPEVGSEKIRVVYYANDGTDALLEKNYYDSSAEIIDSTFVRETYDFIGWNTMKDRSGDYYQPGDVITNDGSDLYVLRLYAQWKINEDAAFPPTSISWSDRYTFFPYVKEGVKKIKGSELAMNGETLIAFSDDTDYFVWKSVKVFFPSFSSSDTGVYFDAEYSFPGKLLNAEDVTVYVYTLSEKALNPSDTAKLTFVKQFNLKEKTIGSNKFRYNSSKGAHVFFVKYNKPDYLIRVNYHSNFGEDEYTSRVTSETSIRVESYAILRRDYYVLTSWNTEADGSGQNYDRNDKIVHNGPEPLVLDLYAQWRPLEEFADYEQTWKLAGTASVGGGVGESASIGAIEIGMAKAEASASVDGTLSAKIKTENGKKSLVLNDEYSLGVEGEISLGPNAEATISAMDLERSMIDLSVAGSAAVSGSSGYSMEIENFDSANPEHMARVGEFALGCLARKTNNLLIAKIFDDISGTTPSDAVSTQLCLEGGFKVDNFKDKKHGIESSVLGASISGTTSYSMAFEDGKTTITKEVTGNQPKLSFLSTKCSIIDGKEKLVSDSASLTDSYYGQISESVSAVRSSDGVESISFGSKVSENSNILLTSEIVSETEEIEYSKENAEKYIQHVPELNRLVQGWQFLTGLDPTELLFAYPRELYDVTGDYSKKKEEKKTMGISPTFKLGAGLMGELTLGLSGTYALSYQTEKGTVTADKTEVLDDVNYGDFAKAYSDYTDIVSLFQDGIYSLKLDEVIKQIASDFGDGIKEEWIKLVSTVGSVVGRVLHVEMVERPVYGDSGDHASSLYNSYAVAAYYSDDYRNTKNNVSSLKESKAYTVGDSYYVYVTDENDQLLKDFLDSPLEMTLSYDEKMLQSAGISGEDAGNLYIYKYDDQLCGYVCIGGTRDIENKSITVTITEAGEYVIAADFMAPAIRNFSVSDFSKNPKISIAFDEASFFSDIRVTLDEKEIVDSANWKEFFNAGLVAISFTPEEELEEGEHVVTVYATDSAGNAMEVPLSYSFVVDTKAPELKQIAATFDEEYIRLRLLCEDKDIDHIAVRMVNKYPQEDSSETISRMDGAEAYYSCLLPFDSSAEDVEFEVYAYDTHGNLTKSDVMTLKDANKVSDAINDLWFVIEEDEFIYSGKPIKPSVKVYEGSQLLSEKQDYVLSYSNNTNAGKGIITVSGKGNYTDKETIEFDILPISLQDEQIVVSPINAVRENGKKQFVRPSVKWGKKPLSLNKDYALEYPDIYEDRIAYQDPGLYLVRVKGIGNFEGELDLSYEIASLNQTLISKVSLTKIKDIAYDGLPHEPDVLLKNGKEELIKDQDYTLSYSDDVVSAGTVTVTINGVGKYSGIRTTSFKITGTQLSKAKLNGFASAVDYNDGQPVLQDVSFVLTDKDKNQIVLKGIGKEEYETLSDEERRGYDYIAEYENNISPGKASVTFTGINGYTGSVKKNYTISGVALSKVKVEGLESVYYDASPKDLDLVLSYQLDKGSSAIVLQEGKDFEIVYSNNVNAGKLSLTIVGKGLYTGTLKKSVKILPYDLAADSDQKVKVLYSQAAAYSKAGAKADVEVYFGDILLQENKDYVVVYKNNAGINDGSDPKKVPSFTIRGKGNFSGTSDTYTFTISARSMEDDIDMSSADKVYSLNKNGWKAAPVLLDNGKKLSPGNDYDKNILYTYEYINGEVRDRSSKERPVINRNIGDSVADTDIVPVGSKIRITVSGVKNYYGSLSHVYRIVSYDISKTNVKVEPKVYTGKEVRLNKEDITVRIGKEIIDPSNYEIDETSYINNIKKGKASVTLIGVNDLGSRKKISFSIGQKPLLWFFANLVHFDANGGSGTMNDLRIFKNTALPANRFSKTVNGKAYRFVGWSSSAEGPVEYENGGEFPYSLAKMGKTQTLYAIWEDPSYTVRISDIYKKYPLQVEEGYKGTLQIHAVDQNYEINNNIGFRSSDESIASINDEGLITFTGKAGKVKISAYSLIHSASDSIEITVSKTTDKITKLELGDYESVTAKYKAKQEYFGDNWQEFEYVSDKCGTIHISNGASATYELFDMWRIPEGKEERDADVRFWHYLTKTFENLDYNYSSSVSSYPHFSIAVRPEYNEVLFEDNAMIRLDKEGNIVMRCFDPKGTLLSDQAKKTAFVDFQNELLSIYDLSINDIIDIDSLYLVLQGK